MKMLGELIAAWLTVSLIVMAIYLWSHPLKVDLTKEYSGWVVVDKGETLHSMMLMPGNNEDGIKTVRVYGITFSKFAVGDTIR